MSKSVRVFSHSSAPLFETLALVISRLQIMVRVILEPPMYPEILLGCLPDPVFENAIEQVCRFLRFFGEICQWRKILDAIVIVAVIVSFTQDEARKTNCAGR